MTTTVQVVFLLDVGSFSACVNDGEKLDKYLRVIRLSCLKLLTYFQHVRQGNWLKKNTVRWGYKYYSSLSSQQIKTKIRQTFLDFKLNEFEEFEEELTEKVKIEYECLVKNRRNCKNVSSKISWSCAERLSVALKEVLCDFQWDSPDITSPVQVRKRGNINSDIGENKQENYVFIVSKCPSSLEELQIFLNVDKSNVKNGLVNCDQVFSCLMSKSVFSTYKNLHKIRLFWLNVVSGDLGDCGLKILSECCEKLNGKIVQISSFVQFSQDYILPYDSVLDFYFNQSKKKLHKYKSSLNWKNLVFNCIVELVPLDEYQNLSSLGIMENPNEIHRLKIKGVMRKKMFTNVLKFSFFCTAIDNIKSISNLFSILSRKKLYIVILCNGKIGILYPLTLKVAMLHFIDVKRENFCNDMLIDDDSFFDESLIDKCFNELPNLPQKINSTSCNTRQFSFNFTSKWFLPQSISFLISPTRKDNPAKEKERQLFNALNQQLELEKSPLDKRLKNKSSHLKKRQSIEKNNSTKGRSKNKLAGSDESEKNNVNGEENFNSIVTNLSTNDEEKLIFQLKEYYNSIINSTDSLTTCAANIINVVMLHVKNNCSENIEQSAKDLLELHLFKTSQLIKKQYESVNCRRNALIIREQELQALLRIETIIAIDDDADVNKYIEEAISLLRLLFVYCDGSYLSMFLHDTLLTNYSNTNRELVTQIYLRLDHTLPAELKNDNSSESEEESDLNENVPLVSSFYSDCGSISSSLISSPTASKNQRNSSLMRLNGENKRFISLTAKEKAKLKARTFSGNLSSTRENDKKKERSSVRRSLFTSSNAKDKNKSSIRKSSKPKLVLKTKHVSDTPEHKQVSNALIYKQARRRTRQFESDLVIEETPVKNLSKKIIHRVLSEQN